MIPIGDDAPSGPYRPWIVYILIAINIAVFYMQVTNPNGFEQSIIDYGFIPGELIKNGEWFTLISSMFMHGSLAHIGGNMLYLWLFGNNVESNMGRRKFLIFYILAGLAGDFLSYILTPGSAIPAIGASGAIAGVMGYYLRAWPKNNIRMMNGMTVPALLFLMGWIVMQVVSGVGTLGQGDVGGTGRWAHIGGFALGVVASLFITAPSKQSSSEFSN